MITRNNTALYVTGELTNQGTTVRDFAIIVRLYRTEIVRYIPECRQVQYHAPDEFKTKLTHARMIQVARAFHLPPPPVWNEWSRWYSTRVRLEVPPPDAPLAIRFREFARGAAKAVAEPDFARGEYILTRSPNGRVKLACVRSGVRQPAPNRATATPEARHPVDTPPPKPSIPPDLMRIIRYGPDHPHFAGVLRSVAQAVPPPEILAGGTDAITRWLKSVMPAQSWAQPAAPRAANPTTRNGAPPLTIDVNWSRSGTEYGRADYSVPFTETSYITINTADVIAALVARNTDPTDLGAIRTAIEEVGEQSADGVEPEDYEWDDPPDYSDEEARHHEYNPPEVTASDEVVLHVAQALRLHLQAQPAPAAA